MTSKVLPFQSLDQKLDEELQDQERAAELDHMAHAALDDLELDRVMDGYVGYGSHSEVDDEDSSEPTD